MKGYLYLALTLLVVLSLLMAGAATRVNVTGGTAGLIGGATGAIVGMILAVFLFYFFFIRKLGR